MTDGRPRVLLVDDEPPILRATRDLLREFEYDVEIHDDQATIHETVRAMRPDILLQDVRMPGLDIRALVQALRADAGTKATRVILFSAGIEAIDIGRELGLQVVQKPFKPQTLLAALRAP